MSRGLVITSQGPLFLIVLAAKGSAAWVYVVLGAAALLGMWLVDRWAARRFGRVLPAEGRRGASRWVLLLAGLAGAQLWKIDNLSFGSGRPSLALSALGAIMLWLSIRDWPFRKYQVVIPAFAFAGAVAYLGVDTLEDLVRWRLAAGGSIVVAFMTVGLLDHLTVVRVFGGAQSSEQVQRRSL